MRVLTLLEKENHFNKLDEYVRELNEENPIVQKYGLEICHVCYMMKIDGTYLYYDYPFDKEVVNEIETFNYDLNDSVSFISTNAEKVLNLFLKQNLGYIYYSYIADETCYKIFKMVSNLGKEEDRIKIENYLPIIHFASNLTGNYKNPTRLTYEEPINSKQLLTIYRPLALLSDSSVNSSLAISFNIKEGYDLERINFEEFENKLVKRINRFFESPVLEKVVSEQRKPLILGYKHNLGRLRPDNVIEKIRIFHKIGSYENIPKELDNLEEIINLYEFTHRLMFDSEFVYAGYTDYDVLFKGKKISQIIEYFNKNFRADELNSIIMKFNCDYVPQFNKEVNNYEIFDFILILWNLWSNALQHRSNVNKTITICSEKTPNEDLSFKFINFGIITNELLEFLNSKDNVYPYNFRQSNNPYPGLLIVRDLVTKNPNLEIKAFADFDNFQTTIQLIIKNKK